MARQFAKVFDTERTQVLFFKTTDNDGAPSLRRLCWLGDVALVESAPVFNDTDDGRKAMDELFDSLDQAAADEFVAEIYEQHAAFLEID